MPAASIERRKTLHLRAIREAQEFTLFLRKTHQFNTKKQLEACNLISIMAEITHLLSPSYDIPA